MKKFLITACVSILFALTFALPLSAQQATPMLEGIWMVKYADGSAGKMTVEKNSFKLTIPVIGEIKGTLDVRSDYFESILDRRGGINFIFGYMKSGALDGKLQERKPCTELKRAFKNGVNEQNSTCQISFTAVKK